MPDYRKSIDALGAPLIAAGAIKPTAVEEFFDPQHYHGLCDAIDAASEDAWFEKFIEKRPHLKPAVGDPGSNELADEAFGVHTGKVNLAIQGQLVRKIGMTELEALATARGTKVGSTRPGKAVADDGGKGRAVDKSNPFGPTGWSIQAHGALVKRLGMEKAAQFAKAAGVKIGDVRPNPNYR